jgi:diaminopimelate decarboxylase
MACHYHNNLLHCDGVDLAAIAEQVGTPCYVYSRADLEARWQDYDSAFGKRAHRVCYAVKANANLSLLRVLQRHGTTFDIVSAGELQRVLAIGAAAHDVVFSGVGKSRAEISEAIAAGVGCINLESAAELERVAAAAQAAGQAVGVAVRVNPDVDARTHPYISTGLKENKFGVAIEDAMSLYREIDAKPYLAAAGIACHIGSQLTTIAPVVDAVAQVVELAQALAEAGIALEHIDVGGGLGIRYRDEQPPAIADLVGAIIRIVPERYCIVMEPGRSLVGAAGVLLTRVEYVKKNDVRDFVISDAAMNDLLRPALYEAWHDIKPYLETDPVTPFACDVVGPICESGDWLGRERTLAVRPGDLLAVMDTGAYGFVMSSNYNSRPRAAEVLVEDGSFRVIRSRETIDEQLANERLHLSEA